MKTSSDRTYGCTCRRTNICSHSVIRHICQRRGSSGRGHTLCRFWSLRGSNHSRSRVALCAYSLRLADEIRLSRLDCTTLDACLHPIYCYNWNFVLLCSMEFGIRPCGHVICILNKVCHGRPLTPHHSLEAPTTAHDLCPEHGLGQRILPWPGAKRKKLLSAGLAQTAQVMLTNVCKLYP